MLRYRGQHTGTDGGPGGPVVQDGLTRHRRPRASTRTDSRSASLLKPRNVFQRKIATGAAEAQPTARRPISQAEDVTKPQHADRARIGNIARPQANLDLLPRKQIIGRV